MSLAYKKIESPIGTLKLVASDKGLVAILWEKDSPRRVRLSELVANEQHPVLVETERQSEEYFAGKRKTFSVALDLRRYSFSERRVGSLACHTVWRDEKLWAACETIREPSGDTSGRGRERKKPSINNRALPSRHWIVWKTYGLRGRTRGESPFAPPREVGLQAVQVARGHDGNVRGQAQPTLSIHGRTGPGASHGMDPADFPRKMAAFSRPGELTTTGLYFD